MLLAQLEGFLTTAREGSVSRAAERLHISQPALTARLQALERELGLALLVRTPRGVRLSDAGDAFLPYAQRVVDAATDGLRLMEQFRDGNTGVLTLATVPGLLTSVLPPRLKVFHEQFPGVRINVRTGHPDDVCELVLRGDAQIGFACDISHPDLECVPLLHDEIVCVLSPEHPAALAGVIELETLARGQLIMYRESTFDRALADVFRSAGIPSDAVLELDSIDAAKKMVENGLGVAFLPRVALEDSELESGKLTYRHLRDAERLHRTIMALRRRGEEGLVGPAASFLAVAEAA
jgi:DNA-binding transcriptional LysR family regulator